MINRRPDRATTIESLGSLDERIVPSTMGAAIPAPEVVSPVYQPNGSTLDRAGQALNVVYSDYYSYYMGGSQGTFSAANAGQVQISGTSVAVDIRVSSSLALVAGELQGIGMKITSTNPANNIIEGQLPVVQIPTVANDSHVVGLAPVYAPVHSGPTSTSTSTSTPTPAPTTTTGPGPLPDHPASLAKAGQDLTNIYQEYYVYYMSGSPGTFTPSEAGRVAINGTSVGVDVHVSGPLAQAVARLQGLGMNVTATSAFGGIVEGEVPIARLPALTGSSSVIGVTPIYRPTHN